MSEREQWVLVESEDELRAGLTVKVDRCLCCARVRTGLILATKRLTGAVAVAPDGRRFPCRVAVDAPGLCAPRNGRPFAGGFSGVASDIHDRRLYRLALPPEADEEEVVFRAVLRGMKRVGIRWP